MLIHDHKDVNAVQHSLCDSFNANKTKLMIPSKAKSKPLNQPPVTTLLGLRNESISQYRYVGILIHYSLSLQLKILNLSCLSFQDRTRLVAATFVSVLNLNIIYASLFISDGYIYHCALRFITSLNNSHSSLYVVFLDLSVCLIFM